MFLRVAVVAALLALPLQGWTCPGCGGATGQTLLGEYNAADLIIVGYLKNPQRNFDDPTENKTELHITSVIKDHPYLHGKKMVILPRYVPPDPNDPEAKIIVFAGVYPTARDVAFSGLVGGAGIINFEHHTFDPYRADPLGKSGELAEYMKGSLAIKDKPMSERLEYYYKFLDAQDLQVSGDAFLEFAMADYKDVREACKKLSMDTVAKRLVDPNTPAAHIGLYSLMLGHSDRKADAAILRKLLDNPKKLYSSGVDGLLIGYVLLDPAAGWQYVLDVIRDPEQEFAIRYAALHALRFFWEYRPDAISKAKLLDGYRLMMAQVDLADMPIEDMRKWNCDDLTADIVALGKSQPHLKNTFVRRSLLKYLLVAAPKNAAASAMLGELRPKYADNVKAAEESLQQEHERAAQK